jgi:integrase
LPASTQTLELYLTHLAQRALRVSTIRRARIAIGLAHAHAGLPRPDQHVRIRTLERGIGRTHGAHEDGPPPLLDQDLAQAVRSLGHSPRDERDRAMLLLGFAAALRAGELAGLNIPDVAFDAEGLVLAVRRSKEDQLAKGQYTRVPFGELEATCPVRALRTCGP